VKDALFEVPPIFELIRAAGAIALGEMYQVFNMGHRMEIYVDPAAADEVAAIAAELEVPAQVVGRCEAERKGPRLRIEAGGAALDFG
jgi:phosphoribosylformylglycinamidine cyclo-ligase